MTVLKEGAVMAGQGWLMGGMTLVFMGALLGWVFWAWSPKRKAHMDAVARLPLEET